MTPTLPASVVPYDPAWPERYEEEAARLEPALRPRLVVLAHVGSTAVPGLAAKPVIDILAGLDGDGVPASLVEVLRDLGYVLRPRSDRTSFRKGVPRTHTLHVVRHGSPEWHAKLAFRDYLRADARAATAYAEVKLALARDATRGGYAAEKRRFIDVMKASADFERFVAAQKTEPASAGS